MSDQFCGLVNNLTDSPFKACLDMPMVNATAIGRRCFEDVCPAINDTESAHVVACLTLADIADDCFKLGVNVDWREKANCCESFWSYSKL